MAGITNPSDQFLEHYGIPGMKWGKRSKKSSTAAKPKVTQTPYPKRQGERPPPKGVTDLRPKPIKQISDTELRNRINRIQMETQYAQLTEGKSSAPKSKAANAYDKFDKGHKAVQKIVAVVGTAQKIYKIYDSPMVRAMTGRPEKEEKKKKD